MANRIIIIILILILAFSIMPLHNNIKRTNVERNGVDSSNWAGYVVATGFGSPKPEVTGVSGSWIVQNVNTSCSCTYSAQWVGIGGFFNGDSSLIQAGTTSQYDCGASFSAWYEILPAAETPINMTVYPGNIINVHIFLAKSPDLWYIYLNDTSENERFFKEVYYNSSMLSAEWIEERPEINGQLSCLSDFGTAYYGGYYTGLSMSDYATVNGQTAPISSFQYENITMVSNSGIIAEPGNIINNGSFKVYYTGDGCYCCFF
ncbi:G1 family glutamic endopeptidase [Picrophilus oshimae]|nr:G1 family glutamic endopeptidase [Picrophilus oshimae]